MAKLFLFERGGGRDCNLRWLFFRRRPAPLQHVRRTQSRQIRTKKKQDDADAIDAGFGWMLAGRRFRRSGTAVARDGNPTNPIGATMAAGNADRKLRVSMPIAPVWRCLPYPISFTQTVFQFFFSFFFLMNRRRGRARFSTY